MTARFMSGNVLLGLCVATAMLAGCKDTDVPKNNEDEVEKPREVECPDWNCTEYITLTAENLSDLEDCYGYDEISGFWGQAEGYPDPPFGLYFWGSPGNGGDCDPHSGFGCQYWSLYGPVVVSGTRMDCPCEVGTFGEPAPDDCCYDYGEAGPFDEFDEFMDAAPYNADLEQFKISLDCGIGENLIDIGSYRECFLDPDAYGYPEAQGILSEEDDDCATEETLSTTPDADYILEVNPSDSYVTVHTPGGEDTVPLTGMGVLDTGTTAFLTGIVDATETLNLVYNWSEWRLWFGGDIDFNFSSGAFVVPYSQGYHIEGAGKRNNGWRNITVEPTANATGAFNSGTGRWYVDYYDTFTGGWVEVHLEGDYYGISL